MVSVEYHIDPSRDADFRRAMHSLRASRLRDGAIGWHLYSDPMVSGRYLELFVVGSWLDHLRQHERVTKADRAIQEQLLAYQRDKTAPVVSHLLSAKLVS